MSDPTGELDPTNAAALLPSALAAIHAELTAPPAALPRWHPAPMEWCANEILGHLIEAERRGFAGRIRIILGTDSPALASWDQVQVARDRRDCEHDTEDLMAEFTALREASIALVAGLRDADLDRGGHHPKVGWLSVRDLLHEWVHHDRNHLKQMLANVQAFVWPSMRNAQRFSAE